MKGQNFARLSTDQRTAFAAAVVDYMAEGFLFGSACMMARGEFGLWIPDGWKSERR